MALPLVAMAVTAEACWVNPEESPAISYLDQLVAEIQVVWAAVARLGVRFGKKTLEELLRVKMVVNLVAMAMMQLAVGAVAEADLGLVLMLAVELAMAEEVCLVVELVVSPAIPVPTEVSVEILVSC